MCRVRAAADFWPSSSSRSRVIDLSKSLMWACQDLRSQSRVIRDVSPSIRKISKTKRIDVKTFIHLRAAVHLWPSFLDLFILQNWIALGLENFQDLNFWLQIQTKVQFDHWWKMDLNIFFISFTNIINRANKIEHMLFKKMKYFENHYYLSLMTIRKVLL